MLRFFLGFLLVAAVQTAALADVEADKRAAANRKLKTPERIAACTRLIENEELGALERAKALVRRGDLQFSDDLQAAKADYTRAIELDPDNADAYLSRGIALYNEDRDADAEKDFTAAIEREPREEQHHYFRGLARAAQKRHEEAIEDFTQAIALNARYIRAYRRRAISHRMLGDLEASVKDCDTAIEFAPYDSDLYYTRGRSNEKLNRSADAIRDFATAVALNPNDEHSASGLRRMGAKGATLDAQAPVAFEAPADNLSITYLNTVGDAVKVSPEDEIVGGLVGWFKKKQLPVPTKKRFLTRRVLSTNGSVSRARITSTFPEIDGKVSKMANYHRSLWPLTIHGPANLELAIGWKPETMDAVWPLQAGNQSASEGPLEYVAPSPISQQAQVLGASRAGDRVKLGEASWKGGVVGWERIVVPAGVFDTIKLELDDNVEMKFFGRTNKAKSKLTLWYAPSVRWWVKRVRETEGKAITDTAVRIVEEEAPQ